MIKLVNKSLRELIIDSADSYLSPPTVVTMQRAEKSHHLNPSVD